MRIHKCLSTVIPLLVLALGLIPATGARKLAANKPKIAVLEFKNKVDNQWWFHGGAQSAQDVFITDLIKSDKFDVVKREQLEELMQQKNLSLSGDVDAKTAVRVGKLLRVNYLLTGALTQYGSTDVNRGGGGVFTGKRAFIAAMNARLIDTSTGKVLWSDEEHDQVDSTKVSVFGVGGGVDDNRMFDIVMKPVIQKLVASLLKGR
jgi:curli biogenesis system outer membrane secretion channel CsgG